MSKTASQRTTWFILALGVLAVVVVQARMGQKPALSAAIGVAVGLANWYSLRFIVGRLLGGAMRTQARFALVLVAKMFALMAVVFVLLRSGGVDAIGFTIGITSLVGGAILGSLFHSLTSTPESEPSDAAR